MAARGGVELRRQDQMKNSGAGDDWRLRIYTPWVVVGIAVLLAAVGVHYKAFSVDYADVPLESLIESATARCRSLGATFEEMQQERVLLHPVPTYFGITVWVEREAWSLPVHETLDRIEDAVSAALAMEASSPRFIQRTVQVVDTVTENHLRRNNESALAAMARKQQIGLGVAKHVYAVDLHEEFLMHGLSFFRVPPRSRAGEAGVRCFVLEERQAYCSIPDDKDTSVKWIRQEISAALATLMARWLAVDSFRNASAMQRWAAVRDAQGCHYAIRALQQLENSTITSQGILASDDLQIVMGRLQSLIHAGKLAHLARAADNLRYHWLLSPVAYTPSDHLFVFHFSILTPAISIGIVALRTVVLKRRQRRARERQRETAEGGKGKEKMA